MDRSTFYKHLRQLRLLTEEQVRTLAASPFPGDDAEPIARALIARGILTIFQARQILAGKTDALLLGQYLLMDQVGQGGLGRVYKAVHLTMRRIVAIKTLPQEEFRREVQATVQLSHPNIVTAYDASEANGLRFLVMEYVDGPNLEDLVKKQGPLPIGVACELMRQAARALQYAHDQGMVHRDIKPSNLLVTLVDDTQTLEDAGRGWNRAAEPGTIPVVKVLDFSLARVAPPGSDDGLGTIQAKAGAIIGTPDFISPEQARDVHAADIRSDLYSLGCTFYFTLTGQVPFPSKNVLEKLGKHLMREAYPVEKLRPEIPTPVAAIVRRLMAKKPDDRFQTPAELAQQLTSWCSTGKRWTIVTQATGGN